SRGNPPLGVSRLSGDGMSKPATSLLAQPPTGSMDELPPGELLHRTFTELRDELVSTLWFLLGNQEDAQDIAQEAFLRCWRTQENLPEILNLRAWIFRVGLNAAKDLQRSAWRRKVKPFLGTDPMPLVDATSPSEALEEQES